MRHLRNVITLLSALFFCLAIAGSAAAEEPGTAAITLTVSPTTLALAPGESAQVWLVASNPFTATQSVTLSVLNARGVTATITEPATITSPRGDVAWQITVKRQTADLPPEPLQLRVDYIRQATDAPVQHIKTATLPITARAPDPPEQALDITLKTGWQTIEDTRKLPVLVIVTNTLQTPITINSITVVPIANITVHDPLLNQTTRTLLPRVSRPFTIELEADNRVVPGARLLVITVDAAWEQAGQKATGSVVVSQPFQVGVYGESAILSATKIPSLLLLPGFLCLTAFLLLRKLFRQTSAPELDFTKPTFWFLGITLSLLIVLAYPAVTQRYDALLTRLIGRPVGAGDLVQAYGFLDIELIWLGATLLGLVAAVVLSTLTLGWRSVQTRRQARRARREAQRRAQYIPDPHDDPLETLRKIARNGKRLADLPYSATVDGQPPPVWLLPDGFPVAGQAWIMPTIEVTMIQKNDDVAQVLNDLRDGPMEPLISALERHAASTATPKGPIVAANWRTGGIATGVQQIEAGKLQLGPQPPGELPLELRL